MADILANLGAGFVNAFQPVNLLMVVVGLAIGILAGVLPGITMLNSIVLVLPFTYLMGLVPALLLMIGIVLLAIRVLRREKRILDHLYQAPAARS